MTWKEYVYRVPLIMRQALRGGRGHEDKHNSVGNHGSQMFTVGAVGAKV